MGQRVWEGSHSRSSQAPLPKGCPKAAPSQLGAPGSRGWTHFGGAQAPLGFFRQVRLVVGHPSWLHPFK